MFGLVGAISGLSGLFNKFGHQQDSRETQDLRKHSVIRNITGTSPEHHRNITGTYTRKKSRI
jgi:hypothetical protein